MRIYFLNCILHIPVVTRFFCPPEIPLIIPSPTIVSAQISRPKICTANASVSGAYAFLWLIFHVMYGAHFEDVICDHALLAFHRDGLFGQRSRIT